MACYLMAPSHHLILTNPEFSLVHGGMFFKKTKCFSVCGCPWMFKVKFLNSHISGIRGPIYMDWKRCESIGCWTHHVTLNFCFKCNLDLGFSRSNFEIAISQESGMEGSIDRERMGCESIGCWMLHVTLNFDLTFGLNNDFFYIQGQILR